MSDTRTQAEKEAAEKVIADYKQRRQAEQDARGPNPLQQPPGKHAGAVWWAL